MSLLTQAYLLEQYGPRLNLDHLAALLEMKKITIHDKVAMDIDPARDWMTNVELADAIQAVFILVRRTVAPTRIFNTSFKHFEVLLAGRIRHAQKGAPTARGQE